MADTAQSLLNDSLAAIDDELGQSPTVARKKALNTARDKINDQLDALQADALHGAAAKVKKAADALQKVVQSGNTDPLAIILKKLKKFAKPK